METLIVISNVNTEEYFFTTDHCQNHGLGSDWVPVTSRIPMHVVKRVSLPDGIIKDKEDYKKVFFLGANEIPNPDKNFQA